MIEVWHCDARGLYSGDTSESDDPDSFAGDFCTDGNTEAESATFYRGQLVTDADGRVNFTSCFPGWYSGRAIHIHYAVTDPEGTTRLTSQFGFADSFADEIHTSHELYGARGAQDTRISDGSDNVFPEDGFEDFLLTTEQNADGSLLAYAAVQIDPTAVASRGGAGGPGRPDGDPPGDRPDREAPPRPDN